MDYLRMIMVPMATAPRSAATTRGVRSELLARAALLMAAVAAELPQPEGAESLERALAAPDAALLAPTA
eukprot:2890242-Lingulodinium_polyedra.AAC.1